MARQVERLFDTFFDLGWLYLHNWGSSCHLMASLACAAMQREGHQARVEMGSVEINQQGGSHLVGGRGIAQAGQVEGHAFCIVDDCLVLDFGLGVARRLFRRDMFWAVAAEALQACDVAARVEHPFAAPLSCRKALVLVWAVAWALPVKPKAMGVAQVLPTARAQCGAPQGLGGPASGTCRAATNRHAAQPEST